MRRIKNITDILKRNIKEPQIGLDACCGSGALTRDIADTFSNIIIYGLDNNFGYLSQGITMGNFDYRRTVPVHGNAYNLIQEHPEFSLVHLDSGYTVNEKYKNLKFRRLGKSLRDLDLVVSDNPFTISITSDYINSLKWSQGHLDRDKCLIPVETFSAVTRKGGHVVYSEEIANSFGGFYFRPSNVTEDLVKEVLSKRTEEGRKTGLDFVDYGVKERCGEYLPIYKSSDIAILFRKI